jgi:thiamine biosynthesis lipoprotein
MASELQLVVDTASGPENLPGWNGAIELLEHLEACWSRFLPTSDISRLNLADGRPLRVDPVTITLVDTMIDAWRTTEHRFDPTILPALMEAGYRASIDDPGRVTILPSGAMHIGGFDRREATLEHIEVDRDAGTVRLPPGLAIDAGGIGKGLAADLSVAHALHSGADGAMTSIGGDIAMGGRPPEGGWTVHVEHPDADQGTLGTISVTGGGVATSSTRSRRWRQDGIERHHVIDPWTGAPSTTDLSSVTVIARSGWLAEAHATAALLSGSCEVIEYLDRHDLSGLAVTGDGTILATDDLAALAASQFALTSTIGAP